MKTLLDTSVLVAACVERHPRHLSAFEWLKKARAEEIKAVVAAHSLLETYSVLTRSPFKPRIGPKEAQSLIAQNVTSNADIVALTEVEYPQLIRELADNEFQGGIVYDGLILFCAQKAGAQKIITSNSEDYIRLIAAFGFDIEIAGL